MLMAVVPKCRQRDQEIILNFILQNEYILYYHSGRKTIRAFRKKDGHMIANFRVQADLKGMETTTDGK